MTAAAAQLYFLAGYASGAGMAFIAIALVMLHRKELHGE